MAVASRDYMRYRFTAGMHAGVALSHETKSLPRVRLQPIGCILS